jgi:hypothetical protein
VRLKYCAVGIDSITKNASNSTTQNELCSAICQPLLEFGMSRSLYSSLMYTPVGP